MTKPTYTVEQVRAMASAVQSEAEFQRQVIEYAQAKGWRVAHFRRVRVQRKNGQVYYETPVTADGAGWPDLVMVRGLRIVAAELKSARGRVRPEQTEWLLRLGGAGVDCFVWRPRDWALIEMTLA